jgi:hypothetical protein
VSGVSGSWTLNQQCPGLHLQQDDLPLHGVRREYGHARPLPGAVQVDADHAGRPLAVGGERVELKDRQGFFYRQDETVGLRFRFTGPVCR